MASSGSEKEMQPAFPGRPRCNRPSANVVTAHLTPSLKPSRKAMPKSASHRSVSMYPRAFGDEAAPRRRLVGDDPTMGIRSCVSKGSRSILNETTSAGSSMRASSMTGTTQSVSAVRKVTHTGTAVAVLICTCIDVELFGAGHTATIAASSNLIRHPLRRSVF